MSNESKSLKFLSSKSIIILFFLILIFFNPYFLRSIYNIDIFWHIKVGEYIVKNLTFPAHDIFNYQHPFKIWYTFQWLYEVLVYFVDKFFGFGGLRFFNALLINISLVILFFVSLNYLKKDNGLNKPNKNFAYLGALFVVTFFIVVYGDRIRVRPHTFNMLFFVLMTPYYLRGIKDLSPQEMLKLFIIAVLFANIHAGGATIFFFIPTLLIVISNIIKFFIFNKKSIKLKKIILFFVFTWTLMLIQPNFFEGNLQSLLMFNATKIIIPEWSNPLFYLTQKGGDPHFYFCAFVPFLILLLFVVFTIFNLKKDIIKENLGTVLISLWVIFLSIKSARFVYLTFFPVLYLFKNINVRNWVLGLGVFAFVIIEAHYYYYFQRNGILDAIVDLKYDLEPSRFPVEATKFLKKAGVSGNAFNFSSWGGFILYELYPKVLVYSDGRGNLSKEELTLMIHAHNFDKRAKALEIIYDLYGVDFIIFKAGVFPFYSWNREKWVRVFYNPEVEVFVRNNQRNLRNFEKIFKYYEKFNIKKPDLTNSKEIAKFEHEVAKFLGKSYITKPQKYESLLKLIAKSKSQDPFLSLTATIKVGVKYFLIDNFEVSEKLFLQTLKKDPYIPSSIYFLGMINYFHGKLFKAYSLLKTSLVISKIPAFRAFADRSYKISAFYKRQAIYLMKIIENRIDVSKSGSH